MKSRGLFTTTLIIAASFFYAGCADGTDKSVDKKPADGAAVANNQPETHGTLIKAGDVALTNPLNQQWVANGKTIYELKCQACHKLTEERLVGPGWSGVTKRREPHWVMNMVTNVETMLETDPEAQKLLEQCLVRMPNQSLSLDESRQVFEFMRSNDGVK